MSVSRKMLVTGLKIGITLLLLGLIFSRVNWTTLKTILVSYQRSYLFLLIGVTMLDRILMSYKWNLLLQSQGIYLSWFYSLRIYIIGNFLADFLPTGVTGDLYRIFRVSSRVGSKAKVTASVLIERAIGLIAIATLALFSMLLMVIWKDGFMLEWVGLVFLFLVAGLSGFFFSICLQPRKWVSRFLPRYKEARIFQKLFELHDAYAQYRGQNKVLLIFFCLSALEQFLLVVRVYLSVMALNITIDPVYIFGISPICHLLAFASFVIRAIGITEGLYWFFFSKVGVSVTQVLAFAILLRVVGLLVVIAGGVFYLLESLKLRKEVKLPG